MPASTLAPKARSTSATRSTSPRARATATACACATRPAPSTSSASRSPSTRPSTWCSTCGRSRTSASTSRRRATSTPAATSAERALARRAGPARAGGGFREAALLPVPPEPVRPQPQPADRLHRLHRRVLGPRHPQRRQPEGQAHRQEPRGTGTRRAGGAGRRRGRRAAPVRGLRRLQHGLPQRRHGVRLPRPGRPGQAAAHPAADLCPRWRPGCRAAAAQRRRGQPG